jgi:hypothetical protein
MLYVHFTTKFAKELVLKRGKLKILDILRYKCDNARRFLCKFTIRGGL